MILCILGWSISPSFCPSLDLSFSVPLCFLWTLHRWVISCSSSFMLSTNSRNPARTAAPSIPFQEVHPCYILHSLWDRECVSESLVAQTVPMSTKAVSKLINNCQARGKAESSPAILKAHQRAWTKSRPDEKRGRPLQHTHTHEQHKSHMHPTNNANQYNSSYLRWKYLRAKGRTVSF